MSGPQPRQLLGSRPSASVARALADLASLEQRARGALDSGICPCCHRPLSRVPTDLYTVKDAAALARVHVDTIRRWLRDGKLAHYGYRGHTRVSLSEAMPRQIGGLKGTRKRRPVPEAA